MTALDLVDLDTARWVRRFEWHLDQLPGILEVLRADAIPLKSARYDSVRVSGSREHAPLPFKVDLIDTADDLWAAVIEYTTEITEHLGATFTDTVTWRTRGGAGGLSSRITGYQARVLGFEVIQWLTAHATSIAALPLNDAEDHLFTMIRRLRAQYMLAPVERPSRRRTCTTCGEQSVAAGWVDVNDRPVMVAECRRCGATYDDPEPGAA